MFFLISAIFGFAMAAVILIGQNLGGQKVDEAESPCRSPVMCRCRRWRSAESTARR
ncbi:hypothetical protein [Paenibacillus sedimenti]|uniref:Uncharacterized protein n=1 Tax=Paenibacillus sedimenti TaxID=2770274 RepID=A0A926KXV8_9BACL|nr:hypothetical protein [Paenibacillus sedimenti]